MSINVTLTPDFRIVTDERNYIVQKRYIVDPTKAPGYKAVPGAAAPELRETWDNTTHHAYYSLTPAGLTAALQHVILRTKGEGATTIAELVAAYSDECARLRAIIERAINGTEVSE